MKKLVFFALLAFAFLLGANAQEKPAPSPITVSAPATLPGNGILQHDFFYAGEGNNVMSIVKKGKVVWSYTDTNKRGEISDAVLMGNGNVLFAHQFGITEISADKKLVWNYPAPPNTEIHTARPIGNNKVLYVQNGNPAKAIVVDIITGKNLIEFQLPVKNPLGTHGHFRHVSITDNGTLLVGHMDMGKVAEYDATGKEIWAADVPSPWYVTRLQNGNTLVSSNSHFVRELNPNGEIVWEYKYEDAPEIKFSGFQSAVRLKNGNTLISNWAGKGNGTAVQAIEVSPDKKIVWALRSWGPEVDLGRSTTIQILDYPNKIENVRFGNLK